MIIDSHHVDTADIVFTIWTQFYVMRNDENFLTFFHPWSQYDDVVFLETRINADDPETEVNLPYPSQTYQYAAETPPPTFQVS